MYTVYLRTNTVNEMKYVGQTGDFKVRNYQWNSLKEKYANDFLTKERNQYGLDNFTTVVLAQVETEEESLELEEYYIKALNTLYPCGYNISKGGKGNGGALKGVPKSEEHKRKIGDANSKKVLQLNKDTGEVIREWSSAIEVQRQLGYSQGNISMCCNGKFEQRYGYKWQYAV